MSARSQSLTRPPGYAPRGTSIGLAGFVLLSVGVPFGTLQSLVPVLARGLDIWLNSALPVVGFSSVLGVIIALGLHKRRFWFVCFWFTTSSLLLAGYAIGLPIGLAVFFRLVPMQHPEYHILCVVNLIMWVVLTPFAWLLLRMLRLHYWQPWTRPETWEPGDETPPRWPSSSSRPASPPPSRHR